MTDLILTAENTTTHLDGILEALNQFSDESLRLGAEAAKAIKDDIDRLILHRILSRDPGDDAKGVIELLGL